MKITDYLSREDIARFTAKSDLHAWRMVLGNWLAIIALFVLVAWYPHPLLIAGAMPLLAGRQLGLAVLTHEAGHRTLFRTPWLNDIVGQWLCALPVFNDMPSYARGHLRHHRLAGTVEDPDLPNYASYPVSSASFRRKVLRDLSGRTGVKLLAAILGGAAGITSGERRASAAPFISQLLVQLMLFLLLMAFGAGWLYLLWLGTFLTVYMLVVRLRQIAEHAAVPDLYHPDPRQNTRTVDAPWWQRLVLAPNGVNYHLEHHFMASVPCYRLAALRRHLRACRALDDVPTFNGYGAVLRHVLA